MRVVYFGTSDCAIPGLAALTRAGHDVILAVTQPDRPSGRSLKMTCPAVKNSCTGFSVPVFQPDDVNSPESLRLLSMSRADAFVVVSYGQILKKKIREMTRFGAVNLHFSLLPKYRGASPINHAIINGEKQTGITIFKLTAKVDCGPIITQKKIDIKPSEDACALGERLSDSGSKLLAETLNLIEKGAFELHEQVEADATYTRLLTKDDGRIDWHQPAEKVRNLVRGMRPWPGAFSFLRSPKKKAPVRIEFIKCDLSDLQTDDKPPGAVFALKKNSFAVACGKGAVSVRSIQPENRKALDAGEFINGYRLQETDTFGQE